VFVSGVPPTQSTWREIINNLFNKRLFSLVPATALTLVAGLAGTWPSIAAAKDPPVITRESTHNFVEIIFDDGGGICGTLPPAWITYEVSDHLVITDHGDGHYHVVYGEHGKYSIDYVDESIKDETGQFTDAQHFNFTPSEVLVEQEQFHDFYSGVKIRVHTVFALVDGDVRVSRDILNVTGCP